MLSRGTNLSFSEYSYPLSVATENQTEPYRIAATPAAEATAP